MTEQPKWGFGVQCLEDAYRESTRILVVIYHEGDEQASIVVWCPRDAEGGGRLHPVDYCRSVVDAVDSSKRTLMDRFELDEDVDMADDGESEFF